MQYWAITDPGCSRPQNQDAYVIEKLDKNTMLFVVCDGMGGAKSGNVASSLASDVFTQEVKRSWKSNMSLEESDMMLENAVKLANFTVHDQSCQFEEFEGMGTTLVAMLVNGKQVTMVNVGDSRGYCITPEGVEQITTDHSLVQMMIQRGELTKEQAKTYPGKNLITRAIGTETMVRCDIIHRRLRGGECMLLCSDGLSNIVDEQEMLFEVVHGTNQETACERLLAIATNRGAPDNVTCVLVQV